MDANQINAAVAAIAAAVGVAAKGGWSAWKSKQQSDATVQIAQIADEGHTRGELWAAMAAMQTRMDTLSADLDKARKDFIDLLGEHAMLKAEHTSLKRDYDTLQLRYAALESRVNSTP